MLALLLNVNISIESEKSEIKVTSGRSAALSFIKIEMIINLARDGDRMLLCAAISDCLLSNEKLLHEIPDAFC